MKVVRNGPLLYEYNVTIERGWSEWEEWNVLVEHKCIMHKSWTEGPQLIACESFGYVGQEMQLRCH